MPPLSQMQPLLCSVCEAQIIQTQDTALGVHVCKACGHYFTVLSPDCQEDYSDDYFHNNWFANPDFGLFRRAEGLIRNSVSSSSPQILEVGCGKGHFLGYVRKRNPDWQLSGIDLNPGNIPGINFIKKDFFELDLTEKYDAVCSFMMIEHVENPSLLVEKMTGILKPGGVLITSTNNNDGLIYKTARLLKILGFRTAYDRLYRAHHLQHFSNSSLERLLNKKGLITIWKKNHNYPLRAVDLPPLPAALKGPALAAVWGMFVLSNLLGNQFLQTYACRKQGEA